MTPDFLQTLTLLLIGLLFFKENMLTWISKKMGMNGNGHSNGNGHASVDAKKIAADAAEIVASNHLHELFDNSKSIAESSKRIEENLTRNFTILHESEAKRREDMAYLKARLNGKS